MSWEQRGSKSYYYRVQRDQDGRLRKTYFGSGPSAKCAYEEDLASRRTRNQTYLEKQSLQALDANGHTTSQVVKALAQAHLLADGYHTHKREWRKRRQRIDPLPTGENMGILPTTTTTNQLMETVSLDTLEEIVKRGVQGDQTVIPLIQRLLDHHPELWNETDKQVSQVQRAWIKARTGNDLVSQEILSRRLASKKSDLLADTASPLERMLVDALVTHEQQFEDANERAAEHQGRFGYVSNFQEKRLANSKRHLESTAKTLAQVQRLLRPKAPVINVANQQVVNVA